MKIFTQIKTCLINLISLLSNKKLIIVFIVLLIIGIILLKFVPDFGLNFLTEVIGIIITVTIIDQIIKSNEAKSKEPIRLMAYEEVRLPIHRLLNLWNHLYTGSTGKTRNLDFIPNTSEFDDLFLNLNLDAISKTVTGESLSFYIKAQIQEFNDLISEVLLKYKSDIPPNVNISLFNIKNSSTHLTAISIQQTEAAMRTMGVLKLRNLENFVVPVNQEYIDSIIVVLDWLKNEYKHLNKKATALHAPFNAKSYVNNVNPFDFKLNN